MVLQGVGSGGGFLSTSGLWGRIFWFRGSEGSTRFWEGSGYAPGKSQPNYDKQFVRDWLLTQDWDRTPPAPELPDEIVDKTRERYFEAYRRITGQALA